jgi:hypothetical protein
LPPYCIEETEFLKNQEPNRKRMRRERINKNLTTEFGRKKRNNKRRINNLICFYSASSLFLYLLYIPLLSQFTCCLTRKRHRSEIRWNA